MANIPQHRTTQRSDASTFCHHFAFFILSTFFYKNNSKSQKYFLFVVQFQRRKPYGKLPYKTYKRPPRAKGPPTTDGAERLTLFRESRLTLPTALAALSLLFLTRPQTTGGRFFCYGWLALQNQPHRTLVGRTAAPPLPPDI